MTEEKKNAVVAYLKLVYRFDSSNSAMMEIEEIFDIEYIEALHTVNEARKNGWIIVEIQPFPNSLFVKDPTKVLKSDSKVNIKNYE